MLAGDPGQCQLLHEFYVAGLDSQNEDEAAPGPLGSWAARAWRQGEPSTCEDRPSA